MLYIDGWSGLKGSSLGRVDKGVGCSVSGCNNSAARSLSREKGSVSGLKLEGEGRRVYLCIVHYKSWKKGSKKSREVERIRYG